NLTSCTDTTLPRQHRLILHIALTDLSFSTAGHIVTKGTPPVRADGIRHNVTRRLSEYKMYVTMTLLRIEKRREKKASRAGKPICQ
ncbi:unnamed protein product, partial [Lampetra planeri]